MLVRQTVVSHWKTAQLQALTEIEPNLVLVFAAPRFFTDPDFSAGLTAAFPAARRLAISTAGEINSQGVSEESAVVNAIRFERSAFKLAASDITCMEDSADVGRRLAAQLQAPDLRAVVLFSQGVAVNGSELIAGVVSVLGKNIPLTGGLAGDYGAFAQTWTLLDEVVSDKMMLALGLYGDSVEFAHGSFGGWQSFGPARRATKVAGNVLYELDGEPALEIYRRYLGEYAKDLPASGLLFPFAILADDRQETGLIRTLLGIDESNGSLTLAGDIPADGYLKLMHASTEALIDGAEAAAAAAQRMFAADTSTQTPTQQSLALLVSCIGRKLVMGDRVDEEVEAVGAVFGQRCVLTGFYSNGEISPFVESTECKLHNQTMTITLLGEKA
jgi:hypothetical protein